MNTQTLLPSLARLSTSNPKNVLVVENHGDVIRVRAARDNFTPERKACFVRYLAAEGYIPVRYERLRNLDGGASGLDWLVDGSVLKVPRSGRPQALRQLLRVLLCAGLLWLALMALAFLHAPH